MPPHGAEIDRPVLEVEHGLGVSRRSLLLAVAIVVGVGSGRQVLVRVVDPVLVEVHLARHRTEWNGAGWGGVG